MLPIAKDECDEKAYAPLDSESDAQDTDADADADADVESGATPQHDWSLTRFCARIALAVVAIAYAICLVWLLSIYVNVVRDWSAHPRITWTCPQPRAADGTARFVELTESWARDVCMLVDASGTVLRIERTVPTWEDLARETVAYREDTQCFRIGHITRCRLTTLDNLAIAGLLALGAAFLAMAAYFASRFCRDAVRGVMRYQRGG